jgi:hypothetical protein
MASGSATAKISIPILAVNGCAPQRTFSVKLTNSDATLTTSEAQQLIASSTNCTYGVTAPAAAVSPGQAMTFTATRSGTYLAGAVALPWTAVPGNSDTTTADFSPAASNVTLPSGAAAAPIVVNTTPTTKDCVPEKAVTVTVTPQSGASASATGKIAPISSGCTVTATVTAPEKPYLPGDEVAIVLSEVTPGRFDLSRVTWIVTSLGNTTYEKLSPAGTEGRELRLRFWSSTAADAAGSVKVDYAVPALPGTPASVTGTLTLDRVAPYPDLVRMDGPGQYSIPAAAKKRYSLLWGGSTRKTTWLNPKANNTSDRKDVRWSYWWGGARGEVLCEQRAGEDCVFALPATSGVTKVTAEVATGPSNWAILAEIPVHGVPAPATTAFEAVRYVPVALEFAGVPPAFFETELTLVNGTAGTVEAELKWGSLAQKEIVGAGRQFVINGLLETLRETNPSQAGAVGPLKVTFRGLASDSDKRLVGVAARTTTPAGAQSIYRRSGRAGLAYRGVSRDELLGGETGQSRAAWLIGLRGTTQSTAESVDRSNLAVAKPDPADPDAVVSIELYGKTGTLLTTLADQTIKSWTQWSILAPTYTGGTEVAYAKVVWKSGGPVTAYATPVNNKSGDGSWVFPVKEEGAGAATTDSLVFPVLFELPSWGEGNFRFLADATLAVPGAQTQTKLDYFWQAGAASGTTSLTNSVKGQTILGSSIDPTVKSLGVVQSLRAGTGSAIPPQAQGQVVIGSALLSRADGQPFVPGTLMAGARVDGPSSEQDATAALYGRFGIYLPAVPMRDLRNLAELRVLGLRQDSWVRSNLALINPGTDPVTLELELQVTKADGSAALVLPTVACGNSQVQNGLVTLPARSFCQIGSVLGAVGATSGYAILSRAGADAANPAKPFLAYGVVNDGPDSSRGTSDGAYLLAELLPLSGVGVQVVDPPGTIGGTLPAATLNAAYPKLEGTAAPAGRTYTFSATGLPAGMTLGQGDNKWFLTGSPTQTGTFSIVVRATDQAGATVSKTYMLSVSECAFTLTPSELTTGKSPGSGSFQVVTASGCSWVPKSAMANASWLTVANPAKQTDRGTVNYSWTQNDGADREGRVEIVPDGQTTAATSFTLKQTAGCSFDLVVTPTSFCKAGGPGTVRVTPSAETCPWSLTGPSWVSFPTETYTGTKTVTFTVSELTTFTQREGDIRIMDAPYAVGISQVNPGPLAPTSNGPICAGNTLQLNVTGGLEGVIYNWTGPNGFTSAQQNPSIPAATVAASGNYLVKQTVNGCDSVTATLAVMVNPNPEITSFTAVPPSITKGQDSTLTATFTNGTGVITPGSITVTSGTGVKVSPTSPTTYTLTVTSTTSPSCGTKTATVAVAVDCPAMTVTPASLSNGTAGVAYGPVTFGSTGGVGTVTYAVSLGALPSGVALTPAGVLSGTPTATGSFNFTVTATDSNGCLGTRAYTLVINKGTATVTITSDNPDPSALGQAVAVAFTVTGSGANPTGNVTVSAPNTTGNCTATVVAGTCNLTFTTAGSKTITATYAGDPNYNSGASDTELHTVNKGAATVTITSDNPDPSAIGQALAVAFTVTGSGATPTGNVTVSALNTTGDCTVTVATGTCNLTFTTAGSKTITATYAGDANYDSGASDTEPHTVNTSTLLSENFNNGNADGWQTFVSGWGVTGGTYQITNTGANIRTESIWTAGTSWGNYTVTTRVRPGSTHTPSAAFLLMRYAAENSWVDCVMLNGSFGRELVLNAYPGGELAKKTIGWADNTWYTLRGTASGGNFSCEVLEVADSLVSGSSATAPATGTVGLRNAHIIVTFDDVSVVSTP